jgi:archaellum component FlaC
MNRTRQKQVVIRLNDNEKKQLSTKVAKSKLRQQEYMIRALLDKDITVIDGIEDLNVQLKRIGNNLNQLTKSVNQGRINCGSEIEELTKEVKELWQFTKSLTQKQS